MPTLSATIGITDNLTTPLRNMANAISIVSANLGDIASETGKLDPKKFSAMQSAAQQLDRTVSDLEKESAKAANAQEKHNKSMREGEGVSSKLSGGFKSLAGAVAGVVAGYMSWQTISSAVDLSDTLSQTTSRLNLINDGMQTTEELQQQIYQAAQNSRGSYQDMADMVGRLGTNAKDAFSSNEEMVRFAEQLNKQFVLAGASADEMAAASLQLTQGLASGTLRGDELNSVMEQAPTVIQTIADSLGVTTGEIRDMAAEGQITADVVKNALLNATDETNAKFEKMNLTFSQVWTNFKNQALMAFQPVLESLNGIVNNPDLMNGVSRISGVIGSLGPQIASVVENIGSAVPVGLNLMIDAFEWIVDNSSIIISGLVGIAGALTAVNVANQIKNAGGIADFVGGIGQSLTTLMGLISPLNLLIAAIAGVAAASIYLVSVGTSLSEVSQFFNNFQQAVSSAVTNIISGIGRIAEGIAESFPAFASQLGSMIPTVIEGILSSTMSLLDAGAQIAIALLNGIFTALPSLISGGIEMVSNIITGMLSMIPRLVEQAFVIVENFIAALSENLPNMLQKGGEAILAFVNGIYAQRQVLMQAGLSAIVGFVQTVASHIPTLIQRGAELIGSLVQGIVAMLPSLAATAISIIANMAMYIIQNLPQIIQAGIQIIGALAQGLITAIPAILSGLGTIFMSFFNALAEYGPQILSAAGEVAANLWNGFVSGLSAGWENLTSFLSDTFNNVIGFVKGIFGIASPSTVFADIGGFLMEGLGNGIQAMWDGISGVIGSIGSTIKDLLTPDVDYAQMIENTRNQIAQLQADVSSGYDTIRAITIQKGSDMAGAMVSIYGQMAVQIVSVIGSMAGQINGQLGQIAQSFGGIFTAIKKEALSYLVTLSIDAIAQINSMIGVIGSTLAGLTGIFSAAFIAVTGSVIAQLTVMQNSAISVLEELAKNALNVLNAIRAGTITTVASMGTGFVESISQMAVSTQTIIVSMAGNILSAIKQLYTSFLFQAGTCSDSYISVWNQTRTTVVNVVTLMSNDISKITSNMISNLLFLMNKLPPSYKQIGIDMMTELAAGIVSQTQAVVDVTNALVQRLKQVFVTGLGIHSPSSVMRYYAEMAGLGWIQGLTRSQMVSFTQSIMEDMKSSFKNGKFEPAQLVQYLDEDTLKVISYLHETGDQTTSEAGGFAGGTFTNPLIGGPYQQTSWFGPRESPGGIGSTNHGGIDIGAPTGTQIVAALPGIVSVAGWYGGYGNAVEIDHGNGLQTLYGHMSAVQTSVGSVVQAGQPIGLVGSTGNSTGPHLHLSMFQNGTAIDPQPYYDGAAMIAGAQLTLESVIQNAYNQAKGIATVIPGLGNINYDISGGAAQWAPQVLQALAMLGQPASLLQGVLYAIESESGGNPNARNDWDSNAAIGQNSAGLLQTIPDTFNAYRNPALSPNIYDPLANIYAALNYMIQRYGAIENVIGPRSSGWYGYASGTSGATRGLHWVGEYGPELVQFGGGERVYPHNESTKIANNLIYNMPAGSTISPFEPIIQLSNRDYGASESAYVDTNTYTPLNSGTTQYQTNNTPINFRMDPTINTREEFDMSVSEIAHLMAQALREVRENNAAGLHR